MKQTRLIDGAIIGNLSEICVGLLHPDPAKLELGGGATYYLLIFTLYCQLKFAILFSYLGVRVCAGGLAGSFPAINRSITFLTQ